MIKSILAVFALLTFSSTAFAGHIWVDNKDSSEHTIEFECDGRSKSITVKSETKEKYEFSSSDHTPCKITGGSITFPISALKDGQSWRVDKGTAESR